MTVKRPYICGPMTGLDNNNYSRFAYLLSALRDAGIDAQSPHLMEANIPNSTKGTMSPGQMYRMVIPGDIYMLATCDSAIALPGYQVSRGTTFELEGALLFEQEMILPRSDETQSIGMAGLTDGFKRWVDTTIKGVELENSAST